MAEHHNRAIILPRVWGRSPWDGGHGPISLLAALDRDGTVTLLPIDRMRRRDRARVEEFRRARIDVALPEAHEVAGFFNGR